MSKLYFETLTEAEKKEFPKLKKFAKIGVLAGGTALALQIHHRRSYDFDIFLSQALPGTLPVRSRDVFGKIKVVNQFEEEFTFTTSSELKITFIYYPFPPLFPPITTFSIKLFHWKDIALDKAYTIGRRPQYRDYVDLFFLMKEKRITIDWIIRNAGKKFGDLFSEKLFLGQLVYFEDLNIFPIEFLGERCTSKEIKEFLGKTTKQYTKEKLKVK